MTSTGKRSIVKALTWQMSGLIILYLMTGSLTLSFTYLTIRICMYFIHERMWQRVKWGWKKTRKAKSKSLTGVELEEISSITILK
ncbi:hypothetical protein GOV10_01900 [Candidatus Woesearchaeota archaeon]|nr:hypothetical protein [Candidatus Woesearchaeota archaeon]